ncbi:SAM-dependent methyltransferase [Paenibacillus pini]|uniref:SAM binding motif n=1 Tax=Paenibacillus pini JCM 16418 TaxID=1236976 RepID=W7YSK1_9BACL|nr:SAM-dependent methyltransferase [Paenibacillus pini]GAF07601.1 SAM binding motif [Paenibacillus pini JCM 16418]
MYIIHKLKTRALEDEYMDDFSTGGAELREALQHLRRLNWIFGNSGPVLQGIHKLWQQSGKPVQLSIIDIGAGSGDVNRRILRWAERHHIDIRITLVDITEEACAEARRLFHKEPRVKVWRMDLFQLAPNCADMVVSSQFLHHFDQVKMAEVVRHMTNASRIGVVINDIHRHIIPWAAVWVTARLISRNRYIHHDGPLSVAKGFRSEDWIQLERGIDPSLNMTYAWKPLFRYTVVIKKPQEGGNGCLT